MAAPNRSGGSSRQLMNNIEMGMRSGGAMGGIMAFMGAPNLAARQHYGYGMGPGGQPLAPYGKPIGWQPPGQQQKKADEPTTGGEDPNYDPNKAEMVKAGLPAWWVDWLNTSGQYGGVPPTPGLLG